MPVLILIGVGANLPHPALGPPPAACIAALDMLAARGVRIVRRSRWYRSAPVPESDQPSFINAVAQLSTGLAPQALLAELNRIEAELGRVRGAPNAARVIDLDLLDHDGAVVAARGGGGLVLPHPRLHERAFVLLPLREVAPEWRHPATGVGLRRMIAALPEGQVCTPVE